MIELKLEIVEDNGGYAWMIYRWNALDHRWNYTESHGNEKTIDGAAANATHDFRVLKERFNKEEPK